MPISQERLHHLLKDAFPKADINVKDLAGNQDHYAVRIVSSVFREKSLVQQHQMVYQALRGSMDGDLHALSIETSVPS